MPADESKKRYSDREVRRILERALLAEQDGGLSHEEVVAAALEVGVSREAVERAIQETESERKELAVRNAVLERRRRHFVAHLMPFLAVNAFLMLLNLLVSPGDWWFLFPLLGWGLGLFFHAWSAFSSQVTERDLMRYLARTSGLRTKDLRRRLRRQRRAELVGRQVRIEHGARRLGEAAEEGLAVFLDKLADEVQREGRQERTRDRRRARVDPVEVEESDSECEEESISARPGARKR